MNKFWIAIGMDEKGQAVLEKNTFMLCGSAKKACECAREIQAKMDLKGVVLEAMAEVGEPKAPPLPHITGDDLSGA